MSKGKSVFIDSGIIDNLDKKAFAERGFAVVTTAAACPTDDYYAFELGTNGATITAIDFGDYASLYNSKDSLVGFEFSSGATYYVRFKSITISAGSIICYKA